jgi:hypothetical protein
MDLIFNKFKLLQYIDIIYDIKQLFMILYLQKEPIIEELNLLIKSHESLKIIQNKFKHQFFKLNGLYFDLNRYILEYNKRLNNFIISYINKENYNCPTLLLFYTIN